MLKISILPLKIHPMWYITGHRARCAGRHLFSLCVCVFSLFSQTLYPSRANAHTFLCLDICGPEACDSCHLRCAGPGSRPPPFLTGASDRRGCAWPLLTAFSEGTSSCRCSATLFISRRERGRDGIWNSICLGTDVCLGPRVVSPRGLTLSSSSSLPPTPRQPLLPFGRKSAATEQDRAGPAHTPAPFQGHMKHLGEKSQHWLDTGDPGQELAGDQREGARSWDPRWQPDSSSLKDGKERETGHKGLVSRARPGGP